MPDDEPRCAECGQPLDSWAQHHTIEDCRWWQQTQPVRDALMAVGRLQADRNRICAR